MNTSGSDPLFLVNYHRVRQLGTGPLAITVGFCAIARGELWNLWVHSLLLTTREIIYVDDEGILFTVCDHYHVTTYYQPFVCDRTYYSPPPPPPAIDILFHERDGSSCVLL